MNLVPINTLFNISYGTKLDLNKMSPTGVGVAFVNRTARSNGVVAVVEEMPNITPYPPGSLTIALGGSVLSTFLQVSPFYTGQNVAVATPKTNMSESVLLYYAKCISANRFRYSTCGREANRTFRTILVPSLGDVPAWVHQSNVGQFCSASKAIQPVNSPLALGVGNWAEFRFDRLFLIKKGKRLTKAKMTYGATPYIGAIDSKNGVSAQISLPPTHQGNTITVSYNGSVAEAFYQPSPFWATDDVNVLYPKFQMTPYVAMFLCTVIRKEKYRFNYGRKWGLERMKASVIKLPADAAGEPDWAFMETYIKSLPFSSSIADIEAKPEPGLLTYMREQAMENDPAGVREREEKLAQIFGTPSPHTLK